MQSARTSQNTPVLAFLCMFDFFILFFFFLKNELNFLAFPISYAKSNQYALFNITWPKANKQVFKLNSAEHEIFPAHKCYNANNHWHFNIYEQEK